MHTIGIWSHTMFMIDSYDALNKKIMRAINL